MLRLLPSQLVRVRQIVGKSERSERRDFARKETEARLGPAERQREIDSKSAKLRDVEREVSSASALDLGAQSDWDEREESALGLGRAERGARRLKSTRDPQQRLLSGDDVEIAGTFVTSLREQPLNASGGRNPGASLCSVSRSKRVSSALPLKA